MTDTETHMYCELVNSTSNTLEINILYKSGIKLNIKANKEHRSINWKYTVKDNVSCNNYYVFLDKDSIIQWLEKYNIKY